MKKIFIFILVILVMFVFTSTTFAQLTKEEKQIPFKGITTPPTIAINNQKTEIDKTIHDYWLDDKPLMAKTQIPIEISDKQVKTIKEEKKDEPKKETKEVKKQKKIKPKKEIKVEKPAEKVEEIKILPSPETIIEKKPKNNFSFLTGQLPKLKKAENKFINIEVYGGTKPYKFSVIADKGVIANIDDSGLIAITAPEKDGEYKITVKANDANYNNISYTYNLIVGNGKTEEKIKKPVKEKKEVSKQKNIKKNEVKKEVNSEKDTSRFITQINGQKVTLNVLREKEKNARQLLDWIENNKDLKIKPRKIKIHKFINNNQRDEYIKAVFNLNQIKNNFDNSKKDISAVQNLEVEFQKHQKQFNKLYNQLKSLE